MDKLINKKKKKKIDSLEDRIQRIDESVTAKKLKDL